MSKVTLEGATRQLFDEIRYQKRFPPREAAEGAKNELALQGLGNSGALAQRVSGVYMEAVEQVLDAFCDAVFDHAAGMGLAGEDEAGILAVLAAAHEEMFDETRGLVFDELRGLGDDLRRIALAEVDTRRAEVQRHLERRVRLRILRQARPAGGRVDGRGRVVFLSHAAADAGIAKLLKDEIERRIPGVWVFLSSDPSDLPPGAEWSKEIQQALQEARLVVLLATSRSLSRPWVWFEAGTVWFTGRRFIPLCLGSIRKGALPPPLGERQALNADEEQDLLAFLTRAAEETGLELEDREVVQIVQELAMMEAVAAAATEAGTGWIGIAWNNRFLCYDGPIESLKLIEDVAFEQGIADALEDSEY
ncbi:MAG: toll/interleukin-1 receptor domain-containing protein, partial [Chloroflexi bacterium]|nr:toll/interleukin-1 receptor domain-containing protein [Chloroflexota bacterium]